MERKQPGGSKPASGSQMSADPLDYILDSILMANGPFGTSHPALDTLFYGLFLPTLASHTCSTPILKASRIAISNLKCAVSVEFSPLTPLTPIRFRRTCFWHKTIYLSSKLPTLASLKWSTVLSLCSRCLPPHRWMRADTYNLRLFSPDLR